MATGGEGPRDDGDSLAAPANKGLKKKIKETPKTKGAGRSKATGGEGPRDDGDS